MKKVIQIILLCFLLVALFFYSKMYLNRGEQSIEPSILTIDKEEKPAVWNKKQKQVGDVFSEEELWEYITPMAVKIESSSAIGSGSIFIIDQERILIASNMHVLIYASDPTIFFFDGTKAPGKVVDVSEQIDLAFVEVQLEDVPISIQNKLSCVTFFEKEVLFPDTKVFVYSPYEEDTYKKCIGVVKNYWEYHPEFHSFMGRAKGLATNGMSGSGVFNEEGYYVGMLSGGKEEEFVFCLLS